MYFNLKYMTKSVNLNHIPTLFISIAADTYAKQFHYYSRKWYNTRDNKYLDKFPGTLKSVPMLSHYCMQDLGKAPKTRRTCFFFLFCFVLKHILNHKTTAIIKRENIVERALKTTIKTRLFLYRSEKYFHIYGPQFSVKSK